MHDPPQVLITEEINTITGVGLVGAVDNMNVDCATGMTIN